MNCKICNKTSSYENDDMIICNNIDHNYQSYHDYEFLYYDINFFLRYNKQTFRIEIVDWENYKILESFSAKELTVEMANKWLFKLKTYSVFT